MNVESAVFDEYGQIVAVIDGRTMTVPDVPDNRHRMAIADWESDGNVIADYEPDEA